MGVGVVTDTMDTLNAKVVWFYATPPNNVWLNTCG